MKRVLISENEKVTYYENIIIVTPFVNNKKHGTETMYKLHEKVHDFSTINDVALWLRGKKIYFFTSIKQTQYVKEKVDGTIKKWIGPKLVISDEYKLGIRHGVSKRILPAGYEIDFYFNNGVFQETHEKTSKLPVKFVTKTNEGICISLVIDTNEYMLTI
jgi:hypothetical protein